MTRPTVLLTLGVAIGLLPALSVVLTSCGAPTSPDDVQEAVEPASADTESAPTQTSTGFPHDSRERYASLPEIDEWNLFEPTAEDLRLAATVTDDDDLSGLPADQRVRVLRAGLRLDHGAARWHCARLADWRILDRDEQHQATLILADGIADPASYGLTEDDVGGAFWHVLEHASAAVVPELLTRIERTPSERLEGASVALVHKYTRAMHVPLLADLLAPESREYPDHIHELWTLLLDHTDRHPHEFARLRFRDAGLDALPPKDSGLSPALTAALEHKLEFLRNADPTVFRNPEDPTDWRRLRDETADASDADLLVALLDEGATATIPLWQLRHLDDTKSLAALREAAESVFEEDRAIALASLTVRGDDAAPDALAELAVTEPMALALLLELDAEAGRAALLEALLAGDRPATDDLFEYVDSALWHARPTFALTWSSDVLRPLHDQIVADDAVALSITAERLSLAAERVPAFWTTAMAETVLRRMPAADQVGATDDEYWWQRSLLLEVGAPERFADWLVAVPPDSPAFAAARRTLLLLGSPRHGAELVASITDDTRLGADDDLETLRHLARSSSPAVIGYLGDVARETVAPPADQTVWDAVVALAIAHGLPSEVHLSPTRAEPGDEEGETDPDLAAAMTERVLAGDPIGAFALQLAAAPDLRWEGAGSVDDERVDRYLRRLWRERRLGHRPWATAELAISGDLDCVGELYGVIVCGHYRWCDELSSRQSTIGHDLGLLPLWIEFGEASCCQNPTATSVWDDYFGLERDTGGWRYTVADLYTRWWKDWAPVSDGRFRRTHLEWMQHWYPVLR